MPQHTVSQIRLNNVTTCLTITADTLQVLADSLKAPFLDAISNTTQAVLKNIGTVKYNKEDCTKLLEATHKLLNAIIIVHIESGADGEMPPTVLNHIGKFTEILYKIHTFLEAQQRGNIMKIFFHQGEMATPLKECRAGVEQSLGFFQIKTANILADISDMRQDAQRRHQEAINLLQKEHLWCAVQLVVLLQALTRSQCHLWSQIFHGWDSELSEILALFNTGTRRIAIVGAGGMGKTYLARVLLHHPQITATFQQNRLFVACNSANTNLELVALIGAHLGVKPGKDLTRPVIRYFSSGLPSLLILDELKTLWEPMASRSNIEELLSLLTERPAKVQWTRPFFPSLKPLDQEAARLTFIDITDDGHDLEEVDEVLSLTDNMPLAISLLAHLADSEGCSAVLCHWHKEKTSLISLSLSSPRLESLPHSKALLSLLSMLPDGLLNADLIQSKLPLDNILMFKTALKATALAYTDEHKRLKVLMPIREYMQQHQQPEDQLIRNLQYFRELLEFHVKYKGTLLSSSAVAWITSNFANIQNVLQWGFQQKHPDLENSIYCACYFSQFSRLIVQRHNVLIYKLHKLFPQLYDPRLKLNIITELLATWHSHQISIKMLSFLKAWITHDLLAAVDIAKESYRAKTWIRKKRVDPLFYGCESTAHVLIWVNSEFDPDPKMPVM
ncbi:hypothetical protein DFH08DRAFT_821588 [Mycena albidolilacea]|uniref:ORC1/DEAH AAA+ ATPase domain-containing protein n=1 Tax=Mycena albidolilacea TaxID=1033008 RepID=A0AAD6Z9S7_9AGAR|nr:hypothetical protein DFH08DRAFT_821588 [Mycena albidolilacea]